MIIFGKKKRCNTDPIPEVNLELETREVKAEVRSFKVAPYVEPTDKEMIEGLDECGCYAEAYRIKELKKENTALKGKLTKLQKKCNAYKEDLDNANIAVKELIRKQL